MNFLKMYRENLLVGGCVIAFFGVIVGNAFALLIGISLLSEGNLWGLPMLVLGFLLAVLIFTFLEYIKKY